MCPRSRACFWLDRYCYNHAKALDDPHVSKSKEELGRSIDGKAGDVKSLQDLLPGADQPEEKESAKSAIAEQKRYKKANALVETLAKPIQLARRQVLKQERVRPQGEDLEVCEEGRAQGYRPPSQVVEITSQKMDALVVDSALSPSTFNGKMPQVWINKTYGRRK